MAGISLWPSYFILPYPRRPAPEDQMMSTVSIRVFLHGVDHRQPDTFLCFDTFTGGGNMLQQIDDMPCNGIIIVGFKMSVQHLVDVIQLCGAVDDIFHIGNPLDHIFFHLHACWSRISPTISIPANPLLR